MDISEIRRKHLEVAVSEAGSATKLAVRIAQVRQKEGRLSRGENAEVNIGKQISAWRAGRGMESQTARDIEKAIGRHYGWMDGAIEGKTLTVEGSEEIASPELQRIRMRDGLLAVRYAVAAMASVMAVKRPAEGALVAAAFRKLIPEEFQTIGFGKEFLEALEGVAEEEQLSSQRRSKR
jgi:hypothetical protein